MVRKTFCVLFDRLMTQFLRTAIIIYYKFVLLRIFFFELLNCLALGKTQRLSWSLFTLPSNQWRRGGANSILHRPIILLVQQLNNIREVDIAGYCIFIYSDIFQNEIIYVTAEDIPYHSNQSVSAGKMQCHQSILKSHQLPVAAVLQR